MDLGIRQLAFKTAPVEPVRAEASRPEDADRPLRYVRANDLEGSLAVVAKAGPHRVNCKILAPYFQPD